MPPPLPPWPVCPEGYCYCDWVKIYRHESISKYLNKTLDKTRKIEYFIECRERVREVGKGVEERNEHTRTSETIAARERLEALWKNNA